MALLAEEPGGWTPFAGGTDLMVLLEAGRADEAETVLWEDLKRNPEHVWTLSLLSKTLKASASTRLAGPARRAR